MERRKFNDLHPDTSLLSLMAGVILYLGSLSLISAYTGSRKSEKTSVLST